MKKKKKNYRKLMLKGFKIFLSYKFLKNHLKALKNHIKFFQFFLFFCRHYKDGRTETVKCSKKA